jgi:hypothetical protein
MNEQAESEQLQNFQERLSKWVSGQGFWFQLRYSLSGQGRKGNFAFHFLRLSARLVMFLLVVAAGTYAYLVMHTGTSSYQQGLRESLKEKLGADQIEMKGLVIRRGEFSIGRLALSGQEGTFFSGLEIRNLTGRKPLHDIFSKEWDPGIIRASSVNLDLRAGMDTPESGALIAAILFGKSSGFKLDSLDVGDMSIRWGYSERSRGSIIGSKMNAERLPDGWKLRFRGGSFTQNWLKRLEIIELDVIVRRDGIVFEKADFRKNKGKVSFIGLNVKSGERPEVSGKVRIRNMDIASLLPQAVRNFVEGTLSAELDAFGSTNSTDGVGFEGDVVIEGDDMIILRDRIHILKALSVVDAFNNYRRIDFQEGSFRMKTHGGQLSLTLVDLAAGGLFRMKGGMVVRNPTPEEAAAFSETSEGIDEEGIRNQDEIEQGLDITLERAARQADQAKKQGFGKGNEESLFDKLGIGLENRIMEEKAAEQLSRSMRYEGIFQISLSKDAFDRAPGLAEAYPTRDATGRIIMEVPLEGVLYELTLKQSDEIYEKGAR